MKFTHGFNAMVIGAFSLVALVANLQVLPKRYAPHIQVEMVRPVPLPHRPDSRWEPDLGPRLFSHHRH